MDVIMLGQAISKKLCRNLSPSDQKIISDHMAPVCLIYIPQGMNSAETKSLWIDM
jgi:hypothetical protein